MKVIRVLFFLIAGCYGQATYGAGDINITYGIREGGHQSTDFSGFALGIQADFNLAGLPLYASIGKRSSVDYSFGDYATYYSKITDHTVGLKLMPQSGLIRPYLGLGFARVREGFKTESTSEYVDSVYGHAYSNGRYVDIGALFNISRFINVGLDIHAIRGTSMVLNGISASANSTVGSVFVGYHWN